jgi:hypothetical protein
MKSASAVRPGGAFVSKDGVTFGQAASMVFDTDKRLAIVAFSNTEPDLSNSTPSGGGVGTADIARHLLRLPAAAYFAWLLTSGRDRAAAL